MRVTVDTNTLISALFWNGNERKIIKLAETGKIGLVLSRGILEELEDVLCRNEFKLRLDGIESKVEEVISKILSIAIIVEPEEKLDVIADDKDDNKILECAICGGADYIVSGDRHLLDIDIFRKIPIIRTKKILEIIKE